MPMYYVRNIKRNKSGRRVGKYKKVYAASRVAAVKKYMATTKGKGRAAMFNVKTSQKRKQPLNRASLLDMI